MAQFPPNKDAALLAMANNFQAKIATDFATYGYTSAQATENATVTTAFADAMAAIDDPATKTRAKVAAKDTAKRNLVNNLRILNRVAQANPALTDEQKIELGLPVYASRSPINPPTDVPVMEVVSTVGR